MEFKILRRQRHLKGAFAFFETSARLTQLAHFVKCGRTLLEVKFTRNTSKFKNNIRLFTFSVNHEIRQFLEVAVQYPIYINANAMLSDGEIWRPLPDEGYRPEKLWAGMGWEE